MPTLPPNLTRPDGVNYVAEQQINGAEVRSGSSAPLYDLRHQSANTLRAELKADILALRIWNRSSRFPLRSGTPDLHVIPTASPENAGDQKETHLIVAFRDVSTPR